MKKYRLFAADLDGTLLDKQGELGTDTLAAIRELNQRGVECVIATGRAYTEIPAPLISSPDIRYIIYSNGAILLDKESGAQISACISRQTVNKMMDILADYEVQICAHIKGANYYDARFPLMEYKEYFRLAPLYIKNVAENGEPTENLFDFIRAADEVEVFSIYFHDDGEQKECAERLLALGGLTVTYTASANFEIFASGAGKDNALFRLASHTGIPCEEMITVGDSDNDFAMTKAAGLGLAVRNASAVLLSVADGTVCEGGDGVARFVLEKYFS